MFTNICWLDVIIILPLVYGLIRGLMRGLVTELVAIVAVFMGFIGARMVGPEWSKWLIEYTHWPDTICHIVVYVLIFIAIAIVCNWLGALFSKLLKAIHLGWLNRLLGAFFGSIKWAVIMLVLIFIVGQLDKNFDILPHHLKQESKVYPFALQKVNQYWEAKAISTDDMF